MKALKSHTGKIVILLLAFAYFTNCNKDVQIDDKLTNQDSIPTDTTDNDKDTIPNDTIPVDTIPNDTIPIDTIPIDTIPNDTLPNDTITTDTVWSENLIKNPSFETNGVGWIDYWYEMNNDISCNYDTMWHSWPRYNLIEDASPGGGKWSMWISGSFQGSTGILTTCIMNEPPGLHTYKLSLWMMRPSFSSLVPNVSGPFVMTTTQTGIDNSRYIHYDSQKQDVWEYYELTMDLDIQANDIIYVNLRVLGGGGISSDIVYFDLITFKRMQK